MQVGINWGGSLFFEFRILLIELEWDDWLRNRTSGPDTVISKISDKQKIQIN